LVDAPTPIQPLKALKTHGAALNGVKLRETRRCDGLIGGGNKLP
jgi:hypothetical protein